MRVEERLLAKAIARQEKLSTRSVVDGKGEHAFEPFDHRLAPLIVAANDHLGIRVIASEFLAQRNELAPKRAMIVDLAVENDDRRARIVRHRLDTAGDVDDRQAAMAEENTPSAVDMQAVAVRTAMG